MVGAGAWKKIKGQWAEAREDEKGAQLLEARRRYLLEACKFNKVRLLCEWIPRAPEEKQQEVFEAIGIPWNEDPAARAGLLVKMMQKHGELVKKFKRALDDLEAPEDGPGDAPGFTMKDFDEALASLETIGFTIGDYMTLPLARYEAMNAVAKKKLEAQSKKNG